MSMGMVGIWRVRLVEVLAQWSDLSEDPAIWLEDPEQLHQWRIGYRRLQTLRYWGPTQWQSELRALLLSSGLKTCMQHSSPLRDLQVALPRIEAWQFQAPLDLTPVTTRLNLQLETGMAEWVDAWHKLRPDRQLKAWCDTLPVGVVPIDEQVVRKAFASAWRRWQRQIDKIVGQAHEISGEAIHQVRIKGKRVRYLGEWWQPHLSRKEKNQLKLEKNFHKREGHRQDLRVLAALMEEIRTASGVAQGKRIAAQMVALQRQGACWVHGRCMGELAGLTRGVEEAIEAIERTT